MLLQLSRIFLYCINQGADITIFHVLVITVYVLITCLAKLSNCLHGGDGVSSACILYLLQLGDLLDKPVAKFEGAHCCNHEVADPTMQLDKKRGLHNLSIVNVRVDRYFLFPLMKK